MFATPPSLANPRCRQAPSLAVHPRRILVAAPVAKLPRPELLPRIQGRSAPSSVAAQRPRLLPRRAPGFPRRRTAALPRWSASASSTGSRARPRPPPLSSSLGGATAATGRTPGMSEYVEAAREMARRPDGGPPRWFTPLECGGAGQRVPGAPTLLFLPGFVALSTQLTCWELLQRYVCMTLSLKSPQLCETYGL